MFVCLFVYIVHIQKYTKTYYAFEYILFIYVEYPPLLNVICRAQFNICQSNCSVNNVWVIRMSHICFKCLYVHTSSAPVYLPIRNACMNYIVDTAFKMLYICIYSIDLNNFKKINSIGNLKSSGIVCDAHYKLIIKFTRVFILQTYWTYVRQRMGQYIDFIALKCP